MCECAEVKNQWIILNDFIEDGEAEGTVSFPYDIPASEIVEKLPIRFNLYDDDGELYFSGRMQVEDFNPLCEFGAGYGCTEIRTRKGNGPLEVL